MIIAISKEKRLPLEEGSKPAVEFALSARDHSFSFARPESLNAINATQGVKNAGLLKGCELIKRGKSAYWGDMQATVLEGPY